MPLTEPPFELQIKNDDDTFSVVNPAEYYWEEGEFFLSLKDMALGTTKDRIFRLYNRLSVEEDNIYHTFVLYFDLSEAFTKFKDLRYDTAYDNSLRKFIKFLFTPGSINSDILSDSSYEISSEYHAQNDTPIVGVFFTRNSEIYTSLISNPNITRKYIVLPMFPRSGEFLSFKLGVRIPSKLETDFLGKAGGFPIKQANFKSPYKESEFLFALAELQKSYGIADTPAKKLFLGVSGPLDPDHTESANTYSEVYTTAGLKRISQRGYFYGRLGNDLFSFVEPKPLQSIGDNTNYLDPANSVRYRDALPFNLTIQDTQTKLEPQTDTRKISQTLLESLLLTSDWLIYYKYDNPLTSSVYEYVATESLASVLSLMNGIYRYIFNINAYPTHTDFSNTYTYSPPDDAKIIHGVNRLLISVLNNFYKALIGIIDSYPGPSSDYPVPPDLIFVPEECFESYFGGEVSSGSCADYESGEFGVKWPDVKTYTLVMEEDQIISMLLIKYLHEYINRHENLPDYVKSSFNDNFRYGSNLLWYYAYYLNTQVLPFLHVTNENVPTGSSGEFFTPFDQTNLFKIWLLFETTNYILNLEETSKRQAWHYINKYAEYYGVYNETPIKIITNSKPVENLEDNVTAVLNDLNTKKIAIQTVMSNAHISQSEKLITIKTSITPIM